MQLTVMIDDDLLLKAKDYTGIIDNELLINEALIALIHREKSRNSAKVSENKLQEKQ